MGIVEVPGNFKPSIPFQYPAHQRNKLIEEYFLEFFTRENIKTEYVYLPVMWTGYHINNDWGNNFSDLQKYCDSLPKDKIYFTVVQYDDGIKIDMPNLITFSCCGNKSNVLTDIPIPLLCDRHNAKRKEEIYLASFIGRIGSLVRPKMFSDLSDQPGFYIKDSGDNTDLFLEHLTKSRFSLCPRGYGISSFRLYESLEAGVIPVYIICDDDEFWLPFSDEIDWSKAAILLRESEIPSIPEILSNIKEGEIEERRNYIEKIYEEYFTMEGCSRQILKRIK